MENTVATRLKRFGPNLSLTGVIVTLAVGVILPVLLSTSVGIVSVSLGERANNLVTGVLVICFTAAAIGGAVTATVLLGRKARTARLQADFLANVTHELRTPLAAIRMYAQTLQKGRLDGDRERTADCLDTIVRETEWLDNMIDQVLTWRSAARDRRTLRIETAPVTGAVEKALDRFSMLTKPGEVELTVDVDTDTPVAHDAEGMTAVMLNLLINAYKYSRDDPRITVRVSEGNREVVLEVEDNGIGISRVDRRRIFDPFFRVDSRLHARSTGVGLGLAITRALVEAHSGRIDVHPGSEGGSRFTVRLPLADPSGDERGAMDR